MNKKYLTISLFLYTLIPNPGIAAIQDITINWSMTNITLQEVQEFQIFSNYTEISANKVQLLNCNEVTETGGIFTTTCNNVTLEQSPVYFSVTAIIPNEDNVESGTWTLEGGTLAPVADFKMLMPGGNALPVADISANPVSGTAPLAVQFDGSNSMDSDGHITSYTWNFGDGNTITTTEANTNHTFLNPNSYPVTLTVTDNAGASSSSAQQISVTANEASAIAFSLAVNFQEQYNTIPTGFVKDWGYSFDNTATPGYGWVGTLPTETRDRNNANSPDQSYDTSIRAYPNHIWEAAMPNGIYTITVCVGDVNYPNSSTHSLQIENNILVDRETTDDSNRWIEKTAVVNVSDGRLTVTFTNSDQFTAFCWITIESM